MLVLVLMQLLPRVPLPTAHPRSAPGRPLLGTESLGSPTVQCPPPPAPRPLITWVAGGPLRYERVDGQRSGERLLAYSG